MEISPQQKRAIEHTGQDVCVVAGPGSGKTRVLVERFAWLVEQRDTDPSRILAITFTEKAANEMKTRLVKRLGRQAQHREAVERAWVSTIDGFCNRLLGENAIAAGLAPGFSVLDAPAAKQMQRKAAEDALDALFVERPEEMRRLMEAIDLSTDHGPQPDLAQSLCDVYEAMRLSGVQQIQPALAPPDVLDEAGRLALAIQNDPGFADLHDWTRDFLGLPREPLSLEHFRVLGCFKTDLRRGSRSTPGYKAASALNAVKILLEAQWARAYYDGLPDLLCVAIARLDAAFRGEKRLQSVTDFTDLEERAIALLESDAEVRRSLTAQFDHVLMDELQDTNRLQWRLVNLIRKNFFAVGDINQSIYGFRHGDPSVFREYREELRAAGGHIDELDENYRSRPEIIETVNRVFENEPGIEPRTLTARGEFAPATGPVVERFVGLGERADETEAALVAARIQEWAGDGKEFSRFAILVRTMSSTGPFEAALDRLGIPFLVSGGRTFLETRETRDLMALLAALVNPLDEIALLTVLRSPLVGWVDEEIFRVGREGWQQEFERLFGTIRRLAGFVPPDRLLAMALDECGYLAPLPDRARANVEKLLAWLRREHRNRPAPLAELLEELEALRDMKAEAEAPPPEAAEAVRIMSIHAAKGLEFPVVFVSALHRGPERRHPVILFSPELGLGVKWRNPATGKGVSDATRTIMADRRKLEEESEENRLLYVAMTRAEDRLILSHAQTKRASPWQKLAEKTVAGATEIDQPQRSQAETGRPSPATQEIVCDAPAVAGQYDSSASVTSVALFDACPRKYYLDRYLGLTAKSHLSEEPPDSSKDPAYSGTPAIELGLEVHRALAGEATASPEATGLARGFANSDLGQRAARATRREREFDFLLAMEDVVLRGQIDLWFEEAEELVLVDYKTDRDESSVGAYALQLRLYALALERYAGRLPDRAALCYLRSGRVREISLTTQELDAARQAVRDLAAAQDKLEFQMKPGEQCRQCQFYKELCTGLTSAR